MLQCSTRTWLTEGIAVVCMYMETEADKKGEYMCIMMVRVLFWMLSGNMK
jgi:hypothetical protein